MHAENLPELISSIMSQKYKIKKLDTKTTNNSLYFVGLTGSGKSSIISYFLGAKIQHQQKGTKFILSHNQDFLYPAIGNTNNSCTNVPSLYEHEGNTFYDPPGFFDTNGMNQQILNSYFIEKMFRLKSKAKIIIMVEFATLLSARGGDLPRVILRLHEIFGQNFTQVISSCVLIISKVDTNSYQEEDILSTVQEITSTNKTLNHQCQMLLKSLVQKKRVFIFPLPHLVTSNVILRIKKNINSLTPFIINKAVNISLSAEAKIEVQNLTNNLVTQINSAVDGLSSQLALKFGSQISNKGQIQGHLQKISSLKSILNFSQVAECFEKTANIFKINCDQIPHIKSLFDQVEFCKTFYPNVEASLKITQTLLIALTKCQNKLNPMLQRIQTRERLQEMERIEEERRIRRQNEVQAEKRRYLEQQQRRQMESYILLEKNKRDYNEVYMETEIKRLVDQEKFKRELAQYTKFKPF